MFRKTGFLIFLAVFLACGWFYSVGGWNQVSRVDAIMSFVEPPVHKRKNPDFLSFRIDHFLPAPQKGFNTGDWAYHDGHYYSNKAPGPLFLGIAVYAPLYWMEYLIFGFLDDVMTDTVNTYIISLFSGALPTALASFVLFLILQTLGCGKGRAAFWALVYGLATPAFCYSTMHWGHPLAAACFIFALYFYLQKSGKGLFFCGLFCGGAVLTDYLSAVLVPVFAFLLFFRAYMETEGDLRDKCREIWKGLYPFALGGLPMLLLFAGYHQICFGSPFTPTTAFNNPVFHDENMVGGTFGKFRLLIFLKLLFSQHRGIFFYSPVLLACFPGFAAMFRKKGEIFRLGAGLLAIALLTLAGVSSFNGWHGGTSCYSRYLIPILPALVIPCAFFQPQKIFWKLAGTAAAILSFWYMLIAAYLTPLVDETIQMPFWGYLLDELGKNPVTPPPADVLRMYMMIEKMKDDAMRFSSFSIGELFGLSGYASVIVLVCILAVLLFLIFRKEKPEMDFRKITMPSGIRLDMSLILATAALILLFAFPGTSVWINDEPLLIRHAMVCNDQNIVAANGLTGSFGVNYGPVAVWLYQLLLMLTFHPVQLVFLKTLCSVLMISWAVKRIAGFTGWNRWLFFALIVSSAYGWHYTRCLWDNVFLLPLCLCMLAFLAEYGKDRSWRSLSGAGICGGAMLLLHPLSLPVVFPLPFFLLAAGWREEKKKNICKAVVGGLIAALPAMYFYLPQAGTALHGNPSSSKHFPLLPRFWNFLYNLSGFDFIDEFIPELIQPGTVLYSCCHYAGLVLTVLFASAFLTGIALVIRALYRKEEKDAVFLLGIYALTGLLLKILFDALMNLEMYKHYYTVAVPLAAIPVMTGFHFFGRKGVNCCKGCILLMLLGTTVIFIHIYLYDGSRSWVYGSTLANQYEVIRQFDAVETMGEIGDFQCHVGNINAFPHAFKSMLFLHKHIYKAEQEKPAVPVKYNVVIRYATDNFRCGLLELHKERVSNP